MSSLARQERNAKILAEMKKKYIGRTGIASNGMSYEVIDYKGTKQVTIRFSDGTVVENQNSINLKTGELRHPSYTSAMYKRDCHIGEQSVSTSGLKMTLLVFRSYSDIDVIFEDGKKVCHRNYGNFKTGQIKHPDGTGRGVIPEYRLGETVLMKCGQSATIIAYKNQLDITVRFEDGTVREHCRYEAFVHGNVLNPNVTLQKKKVGEQSVNQDGEQMILKEYKNSKEVMVEFSDGVQIRTDYYRFLKGLPRHPRWFEKKYFGKTYLFANGIHGTVIGCNNAKDITVKFETGLEVKTTTPSLAKGKLKHKFPYRLNADIVLIGSAYTTNDETNFYYCCAACGLKDVGSMQDIRDHVCEQVYVLVE